MKSMSSTLISSAAVDTLLVMTVSGLTSSSSGATAFAVDGIVQHHHLAGLDIIQRCPRQRILLGSIDRHPVAESAFVEAGRLDRHRAVQLAQHALLRQPVDMPVDGHARHAEMLDQIVDAHLTELDHIVGDLFASFVGLDHASPPGRASLSIVGQCGFICSAMRQ